MRRTFRNRREAGRALAVALTGYRDEADVLVLALPRGGVPVAFEVAEHLGAPLDVLVVRKLGVPDHEELAMGAIASGGVRVVNERVAHDLDISDRSLDDVIRREEEELARREDLFRGGAPTLDVKGKTVILIDDGLATGSTMRAAIAAVRKRGADRVVVGVPTSSRATKDEVGAEVDAIVCVATPEPFQAVGLWYEDFAQTQDTEVRDLLNEARARAVDRANEERSER